MTKKEDCWHKDWVEVAEGPDIDGHYLHLYRCIECGVLNLGVETK